MHQSKTTKVVLVSIGGIILALVIFKAGVVVGYHRAAFSLKLGDNYYRMFEGRRPGMMGDFIGGDLPGGHGAAGVVLKINFPLVVIEGRDGIEKTLVISSSTEIRKFKDVVSVSDLKVNDQIVALGFPNSHGQIEARLIRVTPPFSELASSTTQ